MNLKINYQDFVNTYRDGYNTALFYPKVLKLKKRSLSIFEIEKKVDYKVPKSTLYFWTNYNKIPLAFNDFKNLKKRFYNKDIEYLATIIGHILGDGGIDKTKVLHYCNTEKFLIEEFRIAMKKVFNVQVKVRKETSGIMRLRYARKFSRALISLFGKFAGEKDKEITSQIDKMPIWWKRKMMQAFYNDDGSVPKTEKYVSLTQKNKDIILWIQRTLKEMDIKSGLSEAGSNWLLRVTGYRNLLKFRDKVNFSPSYRKQIQLEEIIKKIKFPHWKTKNRIIELLRKGLRTRQEIADIIKMDKGVVYGHLHGWRRCHKTSTLGLIDLEMVRVKKNGRTNLYYI
ncbi:MAG: LAGLIDADG family homing endonuclease [Candidatus Nealsonbacteria bacterium]